MLLVVLIILFMPFYSLLKTTKTSNRGHTQCINKVCLKNYFAILSSSDQINTPPVHRDLMTCTVFDVKIKINPS